MVLLDIEAQFAGQHDRWLYAMASIDHYAQRLCPDAAEREKFLETMAENFLNEQSTVTTRSGNIVALGARFRDMRKPFDALRTGTPALNAWNARLQKQMQSRNDVIEQLMVLLRETSKEKQLGVLQSLMHMHCNRFAPSEPRLHETVFYDFAKRLERARQAKQRGTKQVQV
jgi:thiopeptide-type bacteriocin biosynthesis protein